MGNRNADADIPACLPITSITRRSVAEDQRAFAQHLAAYQKISRFQLLRAYQLQDQHPYATIIDCIAALGLMSIEELTALRAAWEQQTQRAA